MTHDPRLRWLKYFISEGGLVIFLPANATEATITTLRDDAATEASIQIIDQQQNLSSISLARTSNEKKKVEGILHLMKSRESSTTVSRKFSACGKKIISEYAVLPSWENPRWFVPKHRTLAPGRMSQMINPSRPLSRVAISAFRFLKGIGQEQLIFPDRLFISRRISDVSYDLDNTLLGKIGKQVEEQVFPGIVYSGSFGPFQKFTLELLNRDGKPVAFAKIGHNKYSKEAIHRESIALEQMYSLNLETMRVPKVLGMMTLGKWNDMVLIQKLLEGGKMIQGLSKVCLQGLIDLFHATRQKEALPLQEYLTKLCSRLKTLDTSSLTDHYRNIRDDVINNLTNLGIQFPDSVIFASLGHGDFTRWNVRENHQSLFVIDWEEAGFRPPGHDLFNLLFSETLQARRRGPEAVIDEFASAIGKKDERSCKAYFVETLQTCQLKPDLLIILYLAEKLAYSLEHVEQHRLGGYSEKESFARIIPALDIVFRHFYRKIQHDLTSP